MAEPEEIATNNTIPSLPPLPGVAPLVHALRVGDGQIWPLGSTGTAVAGATTLQPPQRILLPAGSAISSLTNPTAMTASSPGAANEVDDTPKKGNVPKRKYPDFSCAFSQDNALLSGDESDGWDNELDNIQEKIAAENDLECDDSSKMEDPVEEVQEFEYICENIAMEEEGNNADADDEGGNVYNSVTVTKKTHTIAEDLKDICKALNQRGEQWSTLGVGMPKKWTHLKFMVELVYELVFPGQTCAHLRTTSKLDDRSISLTRTLSSFKLVNEAHLDEEVDLNCDTGREEYLAMKAPTVMTKKTMRMNDKWPRWFDGMRHASLPVTMRHCHYCHYQYKYEFDDEQRKVFQKMHKNREHVRRCLVCNVNLCYICKNEFHGVQCVSLQNS
jgi:hypothetical protein